VASGDIVPFGKYRGQPIEVLRSDPGYVQWLLGQDWVRDRFAAIHTLIVNNFGAPAETPEHNALQAKFLDDGFCINVLAALEWEPAINYVPWAQQAQNKIGAAEQQLAKLRETLAEAEDFEEPAEDDDCGWLTPTLEEAFPEFAQGYDPQGHTSADTLEDVQANIASAIDDCLSDIDHLAEELSESRGWLGHEFEVRGWDVHLWAQRDPDDEIYDWTPDRTRRIIAAWAAGIEVWAELKPALGDDYPAILRQMKANDVKPISELLRRAGVTASPLDGEKVLIFDRFTASGASLDQVKAIFAASGFTVLALEEIGDG
jgi:hypothetical protein